MSNNSELRKINKYIRTTSLFRGWGFVLPADIEQWKWHFMDEQTNKFCLVRCELFNDFNKCWKRTISCGFVH